VARHAKFVTTKGMGGCEFDSGHHDLIDGNVWKSIRFLQRPFHRANIRYGEADLLAKRRSEFEALDATPTWRVTSRRLLHSSALATP